MDNQQRSTIHLPTILINLLTVILGVLIAAWLYGSAVPYCAKFFGH